jgi:hypothetical protein
MSADETAPALLKNCRIWQLRPGAAVWKDIVSFGKPLPEPALEDYAVVYDGQLDSNDLEAIYDKFTERRPPGFPGIRCRSPTLWSFTTAAAAPFTISTALASAGGVFPAGAGL